MYRADAEHFVLTISIITIIIKIVIIGVTIACQAGLGACGTHLSSPGRLGLSNLIGNQTDGERQTEPCHYKFS